MLETLTLNHKLQVPDRPPVSLIDKTVETGENGEEDSPCRYPGNGGKGLLIVQSSLLFKTSGNQPCLEFVQITISVSFECKHPLDCGCHVASLFSVHHTPCSFREETAQLTVHCSEPMLLVWTLKRSSHCFGLSDPLSPGIGQLVRCHVCSRLCMLRIMHCSLVC